MPESVGSTIDMLLELDRDTIIGAIILAFLIAALTAGAYLWLRRNKSDVSSILVSLILVANLACLATGAGFAQSRSPGIHAGSPGAARHEIPRHPGRHGTSWRRTSHPRPAPADRPASDEVTPPHPEL